MSIRIMVTTVDIGKWNLKICVVLFNRYFSLNNERRQRDESQHKREYERLRKQINQSQTSYPTRSFEHDFAKQQDFKRRITRYPSTKN